MNQGAFFMLKTYNHRDNSIDFIANLKIDKDKPWLIRVEEYSETKSQAQIRLARMWAKQVAQQGQEHTADHVHQLGKYHFGLPILLAEDQGFAEFWQKVIPMFPSYEDKIEILMPRTPITSIMTVKQMQQYLTDFQRVQSQRYNLTDPSLFNLEI